MSCERESKGDSSSLRTVRVKSEGERREERVERGEERGEREGTQRCSSEWACGGDSEGAMRGDTVKRDRSKRGKTRERE